MNTVFIINNSFGSFNSSI